MRTIGVISDTHGLLRPQALDALAGSELILHAGDVGESEILEALEAIAPVRVVRGNTDHGELGRRLPETEVIGLATSDGATAEYADGPLAYMLHDLAHLDLDPGAAGFAVVVSGHTHRPLVEEREGVLYVNPGSAGPRRFRLPVSVARLRVDGGSVTAEILELDVGA